MLAISLMRMGAKGKPFYRLVVKEKRSKRDGAYLENLARTIQWQTRPRLSEA
jgi:ribosomal protein S16